MVPYVISSTHGSLQKLVLISASTVHCTFKDGRIFLVESRVRSTNKLCNWQ